MYYILLYNVYIIIMYYILLYMYYKKPIKLRTDKKSCTQTKSSLPPRHCYFKYILFSWSNENPDNVRTNKPTCVLRFVVLLTRCYLFSLDVTQSVVNRQRLDLSSILSFSFSLLFHYICMETWFVDETVHESRDISRIARKRIVSRRYFIHHQDIVFFIKN